MPDVRDFRLDLRAQAEDIATFDRLIGSGELELHLRVAPNVTVAEQVRRRLLSLFDRGQHDLILVLHREQVAERLDLRADVEHVPGLLRRFALDVVLNLSDEAPDLLARPDGPLNHAVDRGILDAVAKIINLLLDLQAYVKIHKFLHNQRLVFGDGLFLFNL